MNFLIPLRERMTLNSEEYLQRLRMFWGDAQPVNCLDMVEYTAASKQSPGVVITDYAQWVVVQLAAAPLDAPQVERIIARSQSLSVQEQSALRTHQAVLVLGEVYGTPDPVARARFAVKVLLTLLRCAETLGCVVQAHGGYWPREVLEVMCGDAELDAETLLVLLTRIEQFQADTPRCCMIHLHGMEQFALPDFRVSFTSWAEADYYRTLLQHCAISAVRDQQCPAPGDIAKLYGDGVSYLLNEVPVEEQSHFGRYGALTLVRLQNSPYLMMRN